MILNRIKIFFLLCLTICLRYFSCKQSKHKVNPEARKLNDSAVNMIFRSLVPPDTNAYKNAISLLNRAIKIDSNYFIAYNNKFGYQWGLKQYDSALTTGKRILKLIPHSAPMQQTLGMVYEQSGDTLSAYRYYNMALSTCNKTLDTMHSENKEYIPTKEFKAINLILLKREKEGRDILTQLYQKEADGYEKDMLKDDISKTRHEFIYPEVKVTDMNANPVKH